MAIMPASASHPLPVLLDTDIGTDIDDVYALILAAVSPEFVLRAVTTVNNDVILRARIARRVLDLLGRTDVPVHAGIADSLTPEERRGWMGHEGQGIDLSSVTEIPEPAMAPARIAHYAQEAAAAGTPLTVFTIGAMTNLAVALRDYPDATRTIGQVIAMASSFTGYGEEQAQMEHNIACDPVAADIVLRSGLPVTLVGLNVTRQTTMTAADVDALEALGGPLAQALVGMHRVWFQKVRQDRSPMHDGLAVALPIDPSLVTLEPMNARVETFGPRRGYTVCLPLDGNASACHFAVSVDVPRYQSLLLSRVQEAVRRAAH